MYCCWSAAWVGGIFSGVVDFSVKIESLSAVLDLSGQITSPTGPTFRPPLGPAKVSTWVAAICVISHFGTCGLNTGVGVQSREGSQCCCMHSVLLHSINIATVLQWCC